MYHISTTVKRLSVFRNSIISHPIFQRSYATDILLRKQVLDDVAKELKFTQFSDWYGLSSKVSPFLIFTYRSRPSTTK